MATLPTWIDYSELDSSYELLKNFHNDHIISDDTPNETMNQPYKNLLNKYSKLMSDKTELSRLYNESLKEQKKILEKCIDYQTTIMELQDKYSKLQEDYIRLTNYIVIGEDNDNEEINKIKIV